MKVWRGMSLMSLSGAEKLFVEISIPERYIQNIEKGMSVTVRIPSEGGMQWNGELIELQDILEPSEQNTNNQGLYGNQEASQEQILKAKILIDTEEDTVLKPGAIAQIIFPFDK
jgi:multidrug resistance efflux pump